MVKLYKFIVNVVFVIIIAFLLCYLLLRITDKIEIYKVKTGSMEEKIHVGDYILIYRKDNYNVGDIVTYTSNDGFITHRIIRKENGKIITKGDANNTEDKEILESTIVGKVILSGGILNIIINYKYVFICFLLSLYLFSCYFDSRNDLNQNEDDTNKIIEEDSIDDKISGNDNIEVNKFENEDIEDVKNDFKENSIDIKFKSKKKKKSKMKTNELNKTEIENN